MDFSVLESRLRVFASPEGLPEDPSLAFEEVDEDLVPADEDAILDPEE